MERITSINPKKGKDEDETSEVRPKTKTITKTKAEQVIIRVVRNVFEALNSGDVSRVHEFISPQYFNHESQMDPVRSKLRGPEEFIDTVQNPRSALLIFIMKSKRPLHQEIRLFQY
jgi:hypothetical protein